MNNKELKDYKVALTLGYSKEIDVKAEDAYTAIKLIKDALTRTKEIQLTIDNIDFFDLEATPKVSDETNTYDTSLIEAERENEMFFRVHIEVGVEAQDGACRIHDDFLKDIMPLCVGEDCEKCPMKAECLEEK